MGKYIASPWGFISGKLADTVGGDWKGVYWNRKRIIPENPGSIQRYYDWLIDPLVHFSAKQMNIRRPVVGLLGYQAKMNLGGFIHDVWQKYCDDNALAQSGISLFVGASARALYNSIPDTGVKFTLANLPDYCKIQMSIGDAEPIASISTVSYDNVTGDVDVVWDSSVFLTGTPADKISIVVFEKPQSDEIDDFKPYGRIFTPTVLETRADGSATVNIGAGLTDADIYVYVYILGVGGAMDTKYSVSKCKKCGA